eukprot:TRINITY_DN34384_c0_g1_i1.p1 TRINITY_DN34384_c0_g1~~TRINITY_DN34384_c0_g1_i1.p1  ORF type:complete len:483 (+),score=89.35 TRINITY_DN34384_c0_g1_i1:32-1480(+)
MSREAQMRIKQDATDRQEALDGLNQWISDIGKTDEKLKKNKPLHEASLPPIRGTKKEEPKFTKHEETALQQKELGNAAFQKQQWDTARQFYSESIKHNPNNAVVFSNRAAAYLKLKRWQEAETDATTAIKLTAGAEENITTENKKAFFRRAQARREMKYYSMALTDLTAVLGIEPNNKQAQTEHQAVMELYKAETEQKKKRIAISEVEEDSDEEDEEDAADVAASAPAKAPQPKAAAKKLIIESDDDESEDENPPPAKSKPQPKAAAKKLQIESDSEESEEESPPKRPSAKKLTIEEDDEDSEDDSTPQQTKQQNSPAKPKPAPAATPSPKPQPEQPLSKPKPSPQLAERILSVTPTSWMQFEQAWQEGAHSPQLQAKYLREKIDPLQYKVLFGNKLEPPMLVEMLEVIEGQFDVSVESDAQFVGKALFGLSCVPRFDQFGLFLGAAELAPATRLIASLSSGGHLTTERVQKLKAKWDCVLN